MKQFNYEELKQYINSNEGKQIAVIMTASDCDKCQTMLSYAANNLTPKYKDIEFVNFEIVDVPMFAPSVIPSIIFFRRGMRSHEGHGIPEPISMIDTVIDWWLTTNK